MLTSVGHHAEAALQSHLGTPKSYLLGICGSQPCRTALHGPVPILPAILARSEAKRSLSHVVRRSCASIVGHYSPIAPLDNSRERYHYYKSFLGIYHVERPIGSAAEHRADGSTGATTNCASFICDVARFPPRLTFFQAVDIPIIAQSPPF